MDRETFRLEVDRMFAGIRSDLRTSATRINGFFYTVRVDVKIKFRKTKKACKRLWREMWA